MSNYAKNQMLILQIRMIWTVSCFSLELHTHITHWCKMITIYVIMLKLYKLHEKKLFSWICRHCNLRKQSSRLLIWRRSRKEVVLQQKISRLFSLKSPLASKPNFIIQFLQLCLQFFSLFLWTSGKIQAWSVVVVCCF